MEEQPQTQPNASNENRAELTPDTPCAVCGADHKPEEGVVVGRVDEESDIPYGLVDFDTESEWRDPHEESFCNECIRDYLMDIQAEIKVLNPRQSDAAGYLLLGIELADADEIINNRPDDSLGYRAVKDYRNRARRHTLQALDLIGAVGPILKGPGRVNQLADPQANQKSDDDRHWLTRITGLGERKADALREAGFESKEDVRNASQNDLTTVRGVGNALAEKIKDKAGGSNGNSEEKEEEVTA